MILNNKNRENTTTELETERALAHRRFSDAGVSVLPYGNAWWIVGRGINQVVGELAGKKPAHLARFRVTPR